MEQMTIEQDGVTVTLEIHKGSGVVWPETTVVISVTGLATGQGAVVSEMGSLVGFVDFYGEAGPENPTTIPVAVQSVDAIATRVFEWLEESGVRL